MEKARVIIAGSRHFNHYETFKPKVVQALKEFGITKTDQLIVVSGRARGTDRMGERFANELGIEGVGFPADWNTHGKGAGPIRNRQMAEYATHLIAFQWDNSRGTANMIKQAKQLGLKVKVYSFDSENRERPPYIWPALTHAAAASNACYHHCRKRNNCPRSEESMRQCNDLAKMVERWENDLELIKHRAEIEKEESRRQQLEKMSKEELINHILKLEL